MASALGRVRWGDPPKSRLVVFDATAIKVLERTVLDGLDYAVLPVRRESYYLSPAIVALFLKNLIHIDWRSIYRRAGRGFFGQLYKIYLLSCLERMKPKVVLTFIDNSWTFQTISRLYKKAEFIAIQNGGRSEGCVSAVQYMPLPEPGYVISMPHLFCFGQYEIDLYRRFGHRVDHYHPFGALMGGYYRAMISPQSPLPEFDICLVSQWQRGSMHGDVRPKLREAIGIIDRNLSRYVREKGLKLCVATRSDDPGEAEYFRSVYGADVAVSVNDWENYATYKTMDKSRVVVAHCSTAAEEALGWGKKVLFYNPLRDTEFFMPPQPGPWLVDNKNYDDFARKMDALRAMSDEEHRKVAGAVARYAVAYDFERPAYQRVREMIDDLIAE